MSGRLSTFALFVVWAGLIASAYTIDPAPGAATMTAAPTAQQAAPSEPARTIAAARPPVPLLVSRPRTYFVAPPPEPPATGDAAVAKPRETAAPADAAAK